MGIAMEWRPVASTGYEVSECGDIRNARTHGRLKGYINSDGYLCYQIAGEHRLASRLVAEAYLPAPSEDETHVAHKDGSRVHNHHSNLRWSTPAENRNDARLHGTSPRGIKNPKAKLTEDQVRRIRAEYRLIKQPGSGRRVCELEERYGVSRSAICDIASGRTWPHLMDGPGR